MEIAINDNKSIQQVQGEFQAKYPYLKIEFYSKPHEDHEGSSQEYLIPHATLIGDARSVHGEGELWIHGNMKVATLEDEFKDLFGLNVQVFRRSGNLWLQTTATDDWTLAEQNRQAADMASPVV